MRDMVIILGIALAALGLGAWIFFYGPQQFENISSSNTQPSVLPAPEPHTSDVGAAESASVDFSVLDQGIHASQIAERKNYAAYDATNFAKLWTMAHGDESTAPDVDFTKNYVIGVFMGQEPTGGYTISVSSVTDAKDTRTVAVTLTKPDKGCVTSQLVTRPYEIIVVPLSMNALAHKDTTTTTVCSKSVKAD